MLHNALIFIGLSSLASWIQAGSHFCFVLNRAADAGFAAPCIAFALSFAICAAASLVLRAHGPSAKARRALWGVVSLAACASGLACAFPGMPFFLAALCLNMVCCAAVAVAWGRHAARLLGTIPPYVMGCIIGVVALLLIAAPLLYEYALPGLASAAICALPPCSIACLVAAEKKAGDGVFEAHDHDAEGSAPLDDNAAPSAEDADSPTTDEPEPDARQALTIEEIREEFRLHQLKVMEPYGLTDREQQIVAMLLDGQTMRGIAEQLFITERTVKFHSKNAYEKLGVHSKKELMQLFSELAKSTNPSE